MELYPHVSSLSGNGQHELINSYEKWQLFLMCIALYLTAMNFRIFLLILWLLYVLSSLWWGTFQGRFCLQGHLHLSAADPFRDIQGSLSRQDFSLHKQFWLFWSISYFFTYQWILYRVLMICQEQNLPSHTCTPWSSRAALLTFLGLKNSMKHKSCVSLDAPHDLF